jgi:hypothetical protein
MTDEWRPDDVRAILDQLSQTIRDAESVRTHVERTLRRPAFWPDRRMPKRWGDGDVLPAEPPRTRGE